MEVLTLYRAGRWCRQHHVPLVPRILSRVIFLASNCVVPFTAEIGAGTRLAYGGMGVVLHARCRIGRDVVIAQQVTVGGRSRREGVPVIEDDCYIGAGAKVLGPVRVGRGSIVGANAVVLQDIPPGSVAVGIPARCVRSGVDLREYRTDRAARLGAAAEGAEAAR